MRLLRAQTQSATPHNDHTNYPLNSSIEENATMMPMRWHCGRSDISTAARSSLRLTTRGMDVLRWLSLERNGRHTNTHQDGAGGGGGGVSPNGKTGAGIVYQSPLPAAYPIKSGRSLGLLSYLIHEIRIYKRGWITPNLRLSKIPLVVHRTTTMTKGILITRDCSMCYV